MEVIPHSTASVHSGIAKEREEVVHDAPIHFFRNLVAKDSPLAFAVIFQKFTIQLRAIVVDTGKDRV
jgi:hypothetical protein